MRICVVLVIPCVFGMAHAYVNFADVPCGTRDVVSDRNGTFDATGTGGTNSSRQSSKWWSYFGILLRFFGNFFVIGGEAAARGNVRFAVSLSYNRRHFCGASLVHKRFVLTAAHCYDPRFEPIWNIEAAVGEYDLSVDDGQAYIPTTDYIMHEKFDPRADFVNDIALYKLQYDVTWGPSVQPICLPDPSYDLRRRTVTAVGWGATSYGGAGSDVPMAVSLPVVSNSVCSRLPKLKLLTGAIGQHQLCAGLYGFTDTCQGDSGGPLVDHEDGSHLDILVGITSYGFMCAMPLSPGIYTRVSSYIPWINRQIDHYSQNLTRLK